MTRSRAGTWSSISLTVSPISVQCAAAAGAGLMLEIEPDVLARQMRRQARPLVCGLESGRLRPRWTEALASVRAISALEVFEAELQLIVIEPLGTPAELAALQLLNDELQPLDLGLCLGEGGALGRERAHQPLQRLHIVRQSGEIDVHETRV